MKLSAYPAVLAVVAAIGLPLPARAQTTPADVTQGQSTQTPLSAKPSGAFTPQAAPGPEAGKGKLFLSAVFGGTSQALVSGVQWRVYQERPDASGSHQLVAESSETTPSIILPDGDYIIHAAYGLAAATRRVSINGNMASERIPLNAGALKIVGMLGDTPIPASRLTLAVYVPERGGSEAKLVAPNAKPGEMIRLPEGNYRIVSTYLDSNVPASAPAHAGTPANATNSVVNAEVRIESGKLTETTVRHRASVVTLKLVNNPGGEALANTSFTVLTPGGDVIREMIGAFPSLVLAEGEYFVIARRDGQTHQATFTVQSNLDREIEVPAK
ncbi:MAG: hypothetical protein JWM36_2869 [Hyphomicrobiales bacterium]|nr:hypothetical protein [Hyphomicrobiales bacterium]